MKDLLIERAWLIECWRCANHATEEGHYDAVTQHFEDAGWFRNDDGYQTCPSCSGRGPA